MRWRTAGIIMAALVGVGCGGENPHAALCVGEVADRFKGRVYRIDERAVAASQQQQADGNLRFSGEIVEQPGTSAERRHVFACTVTPAAGDNPARIVGFAFEIEGSGLVR